MNDINDIYRTRNRYHADFRGTLRNERKFDYGQKVFIGSGSGNNIMVFPAIIKGITDDEDPDNPTYTYKVRLPEWAVKEEESMYRAYDLLSVPWYKLLLRYRMWKSNRDFKDSDAKYKNLRCDRIFTSIDQAKKSILDNHLWMMKVERKNIDLYFSRFDKVNK